MIPISVVQAGAPVAAVAHACPAHMTYAEAGVVGLMQGVAELFPVSSLGHSVLIPALVGGCWAKNLNVAAEESPYLAYIVGLHVATAIALIIYFWRDWVRIIGGFFSSLAHFAVPRHGERRFELRSANQRLAWMIILGTIPVGLTGLVFEHTFRVIFGKATYAAAFLVVNGLILLAGERYRRRAPQADGPAAADGYTGEYPREPAGEYAPGYSRRHAAPVAYQDDSGYYRNEPQPYQRERWFFEYEDEDTAYQGGTRRAGGRQAQRAEEMDEAAASDDRLGAMNYGRAVFIGTAQILALLAGISRSGSTIVAGMMRGLSHEDAARFAFLLATPVILAAGALKIPDLMGPLGNGIHGQVLLGSVLSGVGAFVSVAFLVRWFQTRTLTPFAIYCLIAGLGSIAYLQLVR